MANVPYFAESETSGDDSVSLTSTTISDGDGKDYEVERILGEWETDGIMWYLTKWEGYPEVQATWQLRETFNRPEKGGYDVFKEWQATKMRVSRGYEKPYDIDDWEDRREEAKRKEVHRKARRKRKKAMLNQMIDTLSSGSEAEAEKLDEERKRNLKVRDSSADSERGDGRPPIPGVLEIIPTRNRWTDLEQRSFIKGLQDFNGPYWDKILAHYGARGSISQLLKDKSLGDMKQQLQALRDEFKQAGRDPPNYLNDLNPGKEAKSQKRAAAFDGSPPIADQTSADEMMETSATRSSKATKVAHTYRQPDGDQSPQSPLVTKDSQAPAKDARPRKIEKESSGPKRVRPVTSDASDLEVNDKRNPSSSAQALSAAMNNAEPVRSPVVPIIHSSLRPDASKKPYSGTARVGAFKPKESLEPRGSRTGVPGNGPARFSAPRRRSSIATSAIKRKPGGIDVTANWNGKPKIRKARTLPTTNAAGGSDKPFRTFKTLGARNSVQKWRRNEPAPDPTQLVFVDPKTGKVPKPSTAGVTSPRTPFRQFQEELAVKEAQRLEIDESNDLGPDNETEELLPDASEPGINSKTSGVEAEPNMEILTSTSGKAPMECSPHPLTNPPVNAPTRPRAHSTRSSQAHTQQFDSSDTRAATMAQQTGAPVETSSLALMGYPTLVERLDLFEIAEQTLVIGNFRIGPTLEDAGKMKLAGFDYSVKRLLLTIKDYNNPDSLYFNFNKICTVTDYERYWHNDRCIGSGYVVPYPENRGKYQSIAAFLACHVSVGMFLAQEFTMLIWPAHSTVWRFLENCLPAVPPGTVLRFAVRERMSSQFVSQTELPVITDLRLKNTEMYNEIQTKIHHNPVLPGEYPINTVFREVFGIEFDRLIASNGQKQLLGKNFFLCFVPANSEQYEPDDAKRQALRCSTTEEHELFVQFLQANGAEQIFSMQDLGFHEPVKRGSWRYFIEKVRSGVVIIHESCGRPDQLPYLAKFLSSREGAVNIWMTSLLSLETTQQSHSHLVRCLPHGGVILLTVSLIMYHPYEALRILRWFRLEQLPNKPSGTWKVAVRPRIREWLLDIHDICCENTWHSPFGDFDLQVYADINTEFLLLLERDIEPFGLMVETWDTEVPVPEAPVVAAIQLPRGRREWAGDSFATAKIDCDAVRWNDEELIQWFSEWAGAHMWDHRKFQVVLGYQKGDKEGDRLLKCYEKGYGYLEDGPGNPVRQERGLFKKADGTEVTSPWERGLLEILPHDQFFVRNKIPDKAALAKKHADFCQKEKDALSRLQAEAEVERREERNVAKGALATIMEICRDKGGTEEQARAVGRRHLLWRRDEQGTASDWEVQECAIDMDWRQPNQYTWISQIISGTKEEGEAALEGQRKEAKRLADKETLSGSQERARMWEDEIQLWAARDKRNAGT